MRVVNVLFKTAVLDHLACGAIASCARTDDNEGVALRLYLFKVDIAVIYRNVDTVDLIERIELRLMCYQRGEIGHSHLLLIFHKLYV